MPRCYFTSLVRRAVCQEMGRRLLGVACVLAALLPLASLSKPMGGKFTGLSQVLFRGDDDDEATVRKGREEIRECVYKMEEGASGA